MTVLMPFLSFLVAMSLSNVRMGKVLAVFFASLSFVSAILCFEAIWNQAPLHGTIQWFSIGTITVNAGLLLNNLSVVMLLLVSFIALLVHIYSLKYMEGDAGIQRYWGYLGLFCFAMLGLVVVDNLLLMYVCWELVGFASYLLIGFWFTRPAAVQANKKAFIINRIGDIGFLIGIMIMLCQFRTLDLSLLFGEGGYLSVAQIRDGQWIFGNASMDAVWLTIAGIAFFMGAVAKSAQFPLQGWLPDAMEGPTAVSSLIHAATMVAAGVFLLLRVQPVFNDTVLLIITCVGAFTAFMAGTTALLQNDIKRILAFSTISQLGYMIMAMGIGAASPAIFHLITHAFFKCLLFLCAGAVIHEMAHVREEKGADFDPQDIRLMGGLRKKMPVTFVAMLLASLALAGLPFSSGYLSKDAILVEAFQWAGVHGGLAHVIPYVALATSWITAFYIARLIFSVFFGKLRLEEVIGTKAHIHEAPAAMRYVLLILPVFCLFPVFSVNPFNASHSWVMSILPLHLAHEEGLSHLIIPVVVNMGSLALIFIAWKRYAMTNAVSVAEGKNKGLRGFIFYQWRINDLYAMVVKLVLLLSGLLSVIDRKVVDGLVDGVGSLSRSLSHVAAWFDKHIVDGLINGFAWISSQLARFFRHFQSGKLQHYFVSMLLFILIFFIYKLYSGTI